jgi:hypothetical protein
VSTIALTPSSTDRIDSRRQRYCLAMLAPSAGAIRASSATSGGLSETSCSLKLSGRGSGSPLKADACLGAGFAVPAQFTGGFGFRFGPPLWGAV